MNKMWEGRFSENSSELLENFNASINFDKNLYKQDIKCSIAHAKMLGKNEILTNKESEILVNGLNQILKDIENNKFEFNIQDEDIHMAVEKRLTEIVGEIGGKLHTARSRNDQVAVDFKLFVMQKNLEISEFILKLIKTLQQISKENLDTLMPGFTHLQHAQPISLSFYLLAYAQMFCRDYERFISSYKRNNFCPLGSAALAGTPHKIDRFETAKNLGFFAPTKNALDSVSDRDFALEILFNISVLFTHTSRFCEEMILWNSQEFSFIKISDKFSTGSSIMPQKKNPDVCELIRGKTGRVYGNLMALLTTMKALPLAYNKDMQEDKEEVFDSINSAFNSLEILNEMLKTTIFDKKNMLKACKMGHLSATDLADFLVKNYNIPFRQAHFITGKCVAKAENLGIDLSEISLKNLQEIYPNFDEKVLEVLDLNNSKEARNSYGGTSDESVKMQINELENWIKEITN